ncbi:Heat shock protein hsp9 [Fulvia fulva]|uniref:Heat shock protein hsp9 n=1 Tax=Passalora fulva TaxID=5499 RepID=A0A9Q8PKJ9_PASFU|nr:Heat shock protein hsp9 [Fulvia fulva]KAK4611499.1 Heat shock protein hsp9 [Fulvia fulva]KAK4612917.1 Heat shock protein hsp9 [Fulvia fulva]UJO24079.1 Heat shock protein hsp9 [Fulvia fulva]WPV21513.1 Heat shock protein hsp9 [Fulvia fulva]WPV35814.1 Heat shock protein hsp9 [Fulvia fulva]
MTDAGRKDLSSKIGDKAQPDSSKSTLDKVGEGLSGAGDKAARDLVPDSQKSTTQSLGDKASRSKDDAKDESILDKAKNAVGMNK